MARIVVIHEQRMVEPAGDDQPREGAEPRKAAFAFIFVQARMAKACRRIPADRAPLVLAIGDVERAIDEHREAKAGAGAEFEHADAALDAIAERHQAHARELRKRAAMRRNIPPAEVTAEKLDHQSLPINPMRT